jgi:uncharacterized protein YndB with AHSA1/START domain
MSRQWWVYEVAGLDEERVFRVVSFGSYLRLWWVDGEWMIRDERPDAKWEALCGQQATP